MKGDWPPNYQEQFWRQYPRRVAKGAAMRALDRLYKRNGVTWQELMDGLDRYTYSMKGKDKQFICHPATFINQERWSDDLPSVPVALPVTMTIPQVWVKEDTEAWKAWVKYLGKRPPTDRNFGWHFPSEFPPQATPESTQRG